MSYQTEALKSQATPPTEPNLAEEKENDVIGGVARDVGGVANDKELQRLRELLKQRDEEIGIL